MKRKWILAIGCLVLVALVVYVYPVVLGRLILGAGGGRGRVMDHWEVANGSFKIRITEYEEKNPVMLHRFNYVFETSLVATTDWRELIDTWTDDDISIPHDSVRSLSDQIGYVVMGESLASTIDGGKTWSIWDAKKQVPNWQCCNHSFIKDVHIGLDGKGQMVLFPRFNGIPATTLYTNDFGLNWKQS